jgi:putative transposase
VRENRAFLPVATMCRILDVSTSGYYVWKHRKPSRRSRDDAALTEKIRHFHKLSRYTYGSPRIHTDLAEERIHVGCKRVARLMKEAGLAGVCRRKKAHTTIRDKDAHPAPDLVDRDFSVSAPNELYLADITYVPTWAGFLYLAVVLDAFNREVVGWAMANNLKTQLVLDALEMALWKRKPDNVIHHSDQGCQYTSLAFGKRCQKAGIRPSMGSVGDCYDNAMCESFFATLETELLDRNTFRTHSEARMGIFDYIEAFYNPRRRHSSLGNLSPIEYERRYNLSLENPSANLST